MSFHPKMPYESGFQQSDRKLPPEGAPFAFTPERRAEFERRAAQYPPEWRKSAILYALFLVQQQQGHISANGMRHVAEVIGCTPADVEDVASYYAMFYRQPVGTLRGAGLPDAVVRAQGRGTRHRGADARAWRSRSAAPTRRAPSP